MQSSGTLHLGSPWVACYYVSVDTLKTQHDQEGWISFINPLPAAALYWQTQQCQICPHDGDLLIFPGAVLHYVHPNLTETPRISIAFNFAVQPEATPWQQGAVYGADRPLS